MNRPAFAKEIKSIINNFLNQKAPRQDGFASELYQLRKKFYQV